MLPVKPQYSRRSKQRAHRQFSGHWPEYRQVCAHHALVGSQRRVGAGLRGQMEAMPRQPVPSIQFPAHQVLPYLDLTPKNPISRDYSY